jgi:transcriptional regulator with XRE-family HTH domain
MSITPEVSAKTLTQLVATEIKVQMARADVRQSQLAREISKTEQWLSVRLRGRQPIDLNDLALIANALGVGVRELLPTPEVAARAVVVPEAIPRYSQVPDQVAIQTPRPRDNRPPGYPLAGRNVGGARTAYLVRGPRGRRY